MMFLLGGKYAVTKRNMERGFNRRRKKEAEQKLKEYLDTVLGDKHDNRI